MAEAEPGATLAWNPEFLREGFAVEDTLRPDRLVYGVADGPTGRGTRSDVLDEVYAAPLAAGDPAGRDRLATAELVKVAANSFLATKISFINAMAELCEADRRRRHRSWPTPSATTTGSGAASSTPDSASAAAACPRTSARSWPAPASSASTRR